MKINNPNQFLKRPSCILFDTDNTLYAYDPAHEAAMEAVQTKATHHFSIEPSVFDKAFNDAKNQVKKQLGETASSHSRLLYMQRMLELLGLGSQIFYALDLEQTYWRTFLSKAILFEGLIDFLDDIRLAGIPTVIVTDLTAQIQFRKMIYFGLDHYFDYIVTSEEAGADKPAAAPFNIALEKARPNGDTIWMIGDNPINDIQGGRETIGAITLQKIHAGVSEGPGAQLPDLSFHNFSEVRNLLKKIA
jgi:HAD superfamily hydrolase (TIGR01549 family)